ncbi:MAG: Abortive infection protein [uncultured Blastococcus sp.]|uniref:Abortive infection protein n=1 Tax=uncultured Blastococcus sp. TaxID=217144 RepID=A0A6J4HVR9_9ACTN|nr:MAG: Abortive infection protein [uncultured Blastococcus sp.]
MTGPGAGWQSGPAGDGEVYSGPPPTRRPEPGQWAPAPWPMAYAPPQYAPPQYAPPQYAPPQYAPPQYAPAQYGPPFPGAPYPGPPFGRPPAPGFPPGGWGPPPGTPPHDVPRSFLLSMRSRDWRWWRPLLGLLLITVVWFVGAAVVMGVALVTAIAPDLELLDLVDPAVLLVTNLVLIVAVPAVWLAWAAAHGMRIGWSSSVLGRLRWRLLLPYTLLALATLGVGIGLSVLLGFAVGDEEVTGPVASFGWLLVVVLLTTPLQSAAEEYVFRGYLSQTIAGWIRRPQAGAVVAGVLSALLFAAAHGAQDPVTFLDRFAFGLAASALVWLTGGLEAAIVLHAVNNVLVFVLAGGLGDGVATEQLPAGTGLLFLAMSLAANGAYVGLVARSRSRLRVETSTEAARLQPFAPPLLTPAR